MVIRISFSFMGVAVFGFSTLWYRSIWFHENQIQSKNKKPRLKEKKEFLPTKISIVFPCFIHWLLTPQWIFESAYEAYTYMNIRQTKRRNTETTLKNYFGKSLFPPETNFLLLSSLQTNWTLSNSNRTAEEQRRNKRITRNRKI